MKISLSETINAPIDKVFQVFADISNAASYISGIDKIEILSGGSEVGVGTRWRETRTMFGKEATEEMEITKFNRNASYEVEAESMGNHYLTVFTFTETAEGGTRVDMVFEGKPLSLLAKLMSPMWMLFSGSAKKALQQDLLDLKQMLER